MGHNEEEFGGCGMDSAASSLSYEDSNENSHCLIVTIF